MRDYEERSYYEIQLDNKQLILVFLAAVTVCVLIFVLGVMVGKGQKEAELAAATKNEVKLPKPELEVIPPRQPKSAVAPKTKEAEPEKKEPALTTQDRFTYDDLDKSEAEPEDSKKQPESNQQLESIAEPESKKQKEEAKLPAPSAKESPPSTTPEKTPEKPAVTDQTEVAKYTVQVMATASRTKADEEMKFLKSRGYTPFLDEYKTDSGAVYKVRIGRFADPESARQLATRLKKDLQLETWVALLD